MSRFSSQLFFACLLIAFGVFFGIEMAKSGIEQVNGPFEQRESETSAEIVPIIPSVVEKAVIEEESVQEEMDGWRPLPLPADKTIHRLAHKTEHVLQSSLQSGVEKVVALFEVLIH